jgi:hypothetical protein
MNERIQKLIEEAVAKSLLEFSESNITVTIEGSIGRVVATIPTEFCEKFAELIIEECKKVIDPSDDLCSMAEDIHRRSCVEMIDKHFGV